MTDEFESVSGKAGKPAFLNLKYPTRSEKQNFVAAEGWLRHVEAYCRLILQREGVTRIGFSTRAKHAVEDRIGMNLHCFDQAVSKLIEGENDTAVETIQWASDRVMSIVGGLPLELLPLRVWEYVTIGDGGKQITNLNLSDGLPYAVFRNDRVGAALMTLLHLEDIRTFSSKLIESNRGRVFGYFTPCLPNNDSLELFKNVFGLRIRQYIQLERAGVVPEDVTQDMLDDVTRKGLDEI